MGFYEGMKTELKIAEENLVKWWKHLIPLERMEEHKQSCQRLLEFLENYSEGINKYFLDLNGRLGHLIVSRNIDLEQEANFYHGIKESMEKKIIDLKQTIKLYEENGI